MSENCLESLETITINDFNEICRLCPSKTNLTQLYTNPETINMLKSCTVLQFDENDGLPDKICQNCIVKTKQTYNFINRCEIIDETYRKCLNENANPQIKVETIFLESNIKEEFPDVEIKQETNETPEGDETTIEHQYNQDQNPLLEFVRLGMEYDCDSLIMRYFTERKGVERLSMHILMTSFTGVNLSENYDAFMAFCRREMTVEQCEAATVATWRRNAELALELRYGRITASKMYMVSCCVNPDECFLEKVIGFYKICETKTAKTNEQVVIKIEKQLNVKIRKRGLVLNGNYPEFAAKVDGVTDDAVIKMKYPKNHQDYGKYIDKVKNLMPKMKMEMHLLMLMANLRTSYLCIIDPSFANTNTIIKVDYNERYFAEILRKCQVFWMTNIYPALVKTVTTLW